MCAWVDRKSRNHSTLHWLTFYQLKMLCLFVKLTAYSWAKIRVFNLLFVHCLCVVVSQGCVRKYHKQDGLKQQKCIVLQLWKLLVWNEGVGRAKSAPSDSCRASFLASALLLVALQCPVALQPCNTNLCPHHTALRWWYSGEHSCLPITQRSPYEDPPYSRRTSS